MKKKAVVIAVLLAACVCGGCTSTDVRTDNWSLDMDRLLTNSEFDKASVKLADGTEIIFEKFKTDQSRTIDLIETLVKNTAPIVAGAAVVQ